jgi:hypothetical protein
MNFEPFCQLLGAIKQERHEKQTEASLPANLWRNCPQSWIPYGGETPFLAT